MQYVPALLNAGIEIEVAPFFDDTYLENLYSGGRAYFMAAGYFSARINKLLAARNLDLLWVEKEAIQWVPWFFERALLPKRVPVVSDYDDAAFHRYDLHERVIVRRLLGKKIDKVMKYSSAVMAGNRYLADRALCAGAKQVKIVPTVVDIDLYSIKRQTLDHGRPRIGWIGSPSTWAEYGAPLMPLVMLVASKHNAVVRVVGAGPKALVSGEALEALPWSEQSEVALIQGMDIGLMPLDDSPWARGKCGYKLIQYMACGLPVIASPVGVNSEIVEHGVNGFLASTQAEWREALDRLLGDAALRHRMGTEGRRKVELCYSLQSWAPRVAQLLIDTARKHPT